MRARARERMKRKPMRAAVAPIIRNSSAYDIPNISQSNKNITAPSASSDLGEGGGREKGAAGRRWVAGDQEHKPKKEKEGVGTEEGG